MSRFATRRGATTWHRPGAFLTGNTQAPGQLTNCATIFFSVSIIEINMYKIFEKKIDSLISSSDFFGLLLLLLLISYFNYTSAICMDHNWYFFKFFGTHRRTSTSIRVYKSPFQRSVHTGLYYISYMVNTGKWKQLHPTPEIHFL